MVEPQSPTPSSRPQNHDPQSAGKGSGSKDERSAARFKRRGARYKARRRAVDILFEAEFRDIDPVDIMEERAELAKDQENQIKPIPEYTSQIVPGVASNLDAIDDAIAVHLTSDWTLDRIPAVDRAVMRVAAWELMFNADVPHRVALSEGIELASEYSHVKAPDYVNAVLDGVATDADAAMADRLAAQREQEQSGSENGTADELADIDVLVDSVIADPTEWKADVAAEGSEDSQAGKAENTAAESQDSV